MKPVITIFEDFCGNFIILPIIASPKNPEPGGTVGFGVAAFERPGAGGPDPGAVQRTGTRPKLTTSTSV